MVVSEGGRIMDLGSFRHFDLGKCILEKLRPRLFQLSKLPAPLAVSLVIPVKVSADEEARRIERVAMRKVLSECGWLVNRGYLDEIIVVGGTRARGGRPDYTVLHDVVRDAYDRITLFRRQVNFVRKYATVRESVDRGIFGFVLKAVHQFDARLDSILNICGVKRAVGFTRIPSGKGAGLWLTIPMSIGHVLCFVDSDIPNFSKKFVVALCHPILRTWFLNDPIRMVKAYYTRLTFSPRGPTRKYRLGGRVTRMFMTPYMRVLCTDYPEIFGGLDSLRYPLSGEYALRRGVIENLRFPNDYSLEISSLVQVREKFGLPSMAQVSLGTIRHIGQSDLGLTKMIRQINDHLISVLESKGVNVTKKTLETINAKYASKVPEVLYHYEQVFRRMRPRLEGLVKSKVVYSREVEERTWGIFNRALQSAGPTGQRVTTVLPAWTELSDRVDYFTLRLWLGMWANQSTKSRLDEVGLIR